MARVHKGRTVGLQSKLANVAATFEPYFTSSQLADVAKVTRDQASKMCNFWATKGLIRVVGNIRLEHRKQPIFVYAKTDEFATILLGAEPPKAQKNLFESPLPAIEPEREERPPKVEPSNVIPMKQRPDFIQRIDDFIAALDMLRDACLNLKEGA